MELINVEKEGAVAILTLNRPKVMNALSRALLNQLSRSLLELKRDESIGALIVTGAGKAFCAGVDLNELTQGDGSEAINFGGEQDVQRAFADFDRPIIGAVNGVAATGGFELALFCDVLVASETARFIDTHARVGLIPGWGLSQRLSRIVGLNRARELSLTGNFLSAEKAERWGLVNHVVTHEELLPFCIKMAEEMASCDRDTLIRYKRLINEGAGMDMTNALNHERMMMTLHASTQSSANIAKRKSGVINRGRNQ